MWYTFLHTDPHFKTWSGKRFDYQGQCDIILVSNSKLSLHVRTMIEKQYSSVSHAALAIGDEVLEVSGHGTYLLNKIDTRGPPTHVGGHVIEHDRQCLGKLGKDNCAELLTVRIGEDDSITFRVYKDILHVTLSGSAYNFAHSTGLMGDYNTGAMVGRDGVTVFADVDEYVQEWQVRGSDPQLFNTLTSPQHPETCLAPAKTHRRLGESLMAKAAATACDKVADPEEKENCMYDVVSTGDIEMAKEYLFDA